MYIPMNYEQMNNINSLYVPSNIKYINTQVYNYWERSLFQRAVSVITLNVPDEWEGNVKDFLYWCLFRFGHVGVFRTNKFGTVFNPGTFKGFDFYYQPTDYLISNPALKKSLELKIGTDCELIKLTPDFRGIWDIISYHAEKLALLDSAINMSILNSKMPWILGAKNKAVANTLKKIYDKITRGDPLVIYDSKLANDPVSKEEPWQFLERKNVKDAYLTTDQLQDFQTVLNNFDCEIGIPTIPYQKKERLVTTEADSRVIDSTSRSVVWKETLDNSLGQVNEMFGLNLSCELRFDPEKMEEQKPEGGVDNE